MNVQSFHKGRAVLHGGDCLDVLAGFEPAAFDAVVTDPPYELGFMGRAWDKSGIAFRPETWAAIGRVMKPGAHLVAFGAPKNFHRMVCAIEDAGFEVRDSLMYMFGAGMPKSHDFARETVSIDGVDVRRTRAEFVGHPMETGWGTALKPAYEPICLARKPLGEKTVADNVLAHGAGALNIDACRVEGETPSADRRATARATGNAPVRKMTSAQANANGVFHNRSSSPELYMTERAGETLGRWPANVCHDGSDEVVGMFPAEKPGKGVARSFQRTADYGGIAGNDGGSFRQKAGSRSSMIDSDDGGSAARFFYSAKADADDRLGSRHPTVKPVDLMQWLVRMVCPPGGLILDPFAGTGTTGEAALREGRRVEMIEREAEHIADIARRMAHVFDGAIGRKVARVKARGAAAPPGALFGDAS